MRIWLILLPFLFLIVGCGLVAEQPPTVAIYELRLPAADEEPVVPPAEPSTAAAPRVEVTAPSWLRSRAMHYRLDYQDSLRRHSYLESRWVAEPAEMIARALELELAAVSRSRGDARVETGRPAGPVLLPAPCRLRLSLDEFIQVFRDEHHNHTLLQVRAQLLNAEGRAIGHRRFVHRQESATPDAAGGVAAHALGLQELAAKLRAWLPTVAAGADCQP